MAALTGRTINTSYKDLITVAGSTDGEGLETSLKQLFDGAGEGSALSLSSSFDTFFSDHQLFMHGPFLKTSSACDHIRLRLCWGFEVLTIEPPTLQRRFRDTPYTLLWGAA